jgi:hypothetical protein
MYCQNNPVNFIDPDGNHPVVIVLAVGGGVYIAYTIHNAWQSFLDKAEKAKKANEEYWKDPTNPEKYEKKEKAFLEAAQEGLKAGATVPGTSITGPVPTSKIDLIVGGTTTLISNLSDK